MQRLLTCAVLLAVMTVAATVVAQPTSRRRTPHPAPAARKPTPRPTPRPAPKPPFPGRDLCASRQSVLTQEQRRLDESQAELAGIHSELAELKRRMAELARRRDTTQRSVAVREARVEKLRSTYKRECTASESCQQYENLAGSLERQAADIEREVTAARAEISRSSTESAQLRREIDPLQREYAKLRCYHLVAGSTAQSTIDRCAAIFSQWNRLQARVNQLNNHLAPLRSHYQRLLSRLRQIEEHGSGYGEYLSRHCKSSPHLAKVRGFGAVRLRAEKLGRELDKLIDEAAKLRSIEIAISAKP